MSIRIYLTGRLAIEVDGKTLIDEGRFRGRQGRVAFAYLVFERTRSVPREELAQAIWSGDLAPSWEGALSALMSRLHGLLPAEPLTSRGVTLARGFGQYELNLPSDVWIDLEVATSAVDRAEGALRMDEPARVLGPATVATTIARRVFLAGVDGAWVSSQRARLERQLLRGLDCLAQMWLASGDPGLAVETALEAVALDTFRERSYQLLMQAYAASGNAAEAVRVYHRLREVLEADLGTEPSPETEAVYRAVL